MLHGDAASETFLSEIVGAQPFAGARHMSMESLYEYGSRAGVWRLLRLFRRAQAPAHGVRASAWRSSAIREVGARDRSRTGTRSRATAGAGSTITACDEATEREHMRARGRGDHARSPGSRPLGWYTGRDEPEHAPARGRARRLPLRRRLLRRRSAVLGDWSRGKAAADRPLHARHQRHALRHAAGLQQRRRSSSPICKDAFDTLYAEGENDAPKMLSVGLHCRLAGRPARTAALARFLDYVQGHDRVWICRRVDIARHWIARHPYRAPG